MAIAALGLPYMLSGARGRPEFDHWLWWLALFACSVASGVLAPMTFPGRTTQQRAIIVSLIGAAAFSWWLWLGRDEIDRYSWRGPSSVGLLLIFGFLCAAFIMRLGWGPLRASRQAEHGASRSSVGRGNDIG